jgi:hypothetical protein
VNDWFVNLESELLVWFRLPEHVVVIPQVVVNDVLFEVILLRKNLLCAISFDVVNAVCRCPACSRLLSPLW